jgi:hypothetical protein
MHKRYSLTAALVAVLFWVLPVLAAPSAKDIEALVKQRDFSRARTGIEQVIRENPDNAKAYYLYAQILHAQQQDAQARQALLKAEQLDHTMEFANPEHLRRFKAELQLPATGFKAPAAPARQSSSGGLLAILLVVLGGIVLVVLVVMRIQTRKQREAQAATRTEALKEAVSLLDFIKEQLLKLETDAASLAAGDPQRPVLEQRVETLREERQKLLKTVDELQQSREGPPVITVGALQEWRERLQKIIAGIPDTPRKDEPVDRFAEFAASRSATQVYESPPPPERVVIERDRGGPGFLTGVLAGTVLGNILNQGHTREHPEHRPAPEPPADEPRPASPDFDLSGLGDDWKDSSPSSDSAGEFDRGNDSSDW